MTQTLKGEVVSQEADRKTGNVRQEDRYHSLFEMNWDAVFSLDMEGRFTEVNPSAERLTGYSTTELLQMKFPEILPPEERERMLNEFQQGLAGNQVPVETVVQRKDGVLRDFTVVTMPNIVGGVVTGLFGIARDITKEKRVEQQLRRNEMRYRALVEKSVDFVTLVDATGRITYESPNQQERTLGYPPGEMVGMNIFERVHPEDRGRALGLFMGGLRGLRDTARVELRVLARDNTYRWLDIVATNLLEDPAVQSIVINSRDTTERHMLEQALQDNEKRFRTLAEAIPQLVWISDAQGLPDFANQRLAEYTGMTAKQARAEGGWFRVYHPEDRDRVREARTRAVNQESLFHLEYRIRRASDGQYRWFLGMATPLRDESGRVVRWFGTATDIHDRKQMEHSLQEAQKDLEQRIRRRTEELLEANAALRESESRYRSLVEQSPDGIGIAVDGRIAFLNRAGLRLLGAAEGTDLNGRLILEFVHVDYRDTVSRRIEQMIQEQQPAKALEEKFVRLDGTVVDVEVIATPVTYQGKTAIQVVFRNITERRRLEQEILAIGEREQRHIAHELHDGLCQHLLGIRFEAGALRRRLTDTNALSEKRNAARIETLLDEAIEESRRISRGMQPVTLESDGLVAALDELAAMVRNVFHTRCQFRCPNRVSVFDTAVATHLFRIAQEAVSNAIKHGKPTQISICLRQSPNGIRMTVSDNGRGLPRTKKRRGGMGLQIMQYRATRIGALLDVRRRAKRGTVVLCWLPTVETERKRML